MLISQRLLPSFHIVFFLESPLDYLAGFTKVCLFLTLTMLLSPGERSCVRAVFKAPIYFLFFFSFQKDTLSDVLTIIEKIQVLCYKFGIRSVEFFKDFDKLRLGLCLEDEFKSGIDLFTRKFLPLSFKQLNDLTNFYRVPNDGRIYYRAFTDLIENSELLLPIYRLPRCYLLPTA